MATMSMDVFVPMEPDKNLGPNSRMHWRAKAGLIADSRAAAKYATINALHLAGLVFPKERAIQISASIHWGKGRKRMDYDNSLSILKSYLDGLAEALDVDDKHFDIRTVEQVQKAPVPGVVFSLYSEY
jgi:crossover junction endodeoxyribonuclease RusA